MIEIKPIHWQDTIAIRHAVLWPQHPPEFCHVSDDETGLHFGGFYHSVGDTENDQACVCVASVYLEGQRARLRKFATLAAYQGQGIGGQMLQYIQQALQQHGVNLLWFDARESAIGFYERQGFSTYGERFYKEDVAYRKMQRTLNHSDTPHGINHPQ